MSNKAISAKEWVREKPKEEPKKPKETTSAEVDNNQVKDTVTKNVFVDIPVEDKVEEVDPVVAGLAPIGARLDAINAIGDKLAKFYGVAVPEVDRVEINPQFQGVTPEEYASRLQEPMPPLPETKTGEQAAMVAAAITNIMGMFGDVAVGGGGNVATAGIIGGAEATKRADLEREKRIQAEKEKEKLYQESIAAYNKNITEYSKEYMKEANDFELKKVDMVLEEEKNYRNALIDRAEAQLKNRSLRLDALVAEGRLEKMRADTINDTNKLKLENAKRKDAQLARANKPAQLNYAMNKYLANGVNKARSGKQTPIKGGTDLFLNFNEAADRAQRFVNLSGQEKSNFNNASLDSSSKYNNFINTAVDSLSSEKIREKYPDPEKRKEFYQDLMTKLRFAADASERSKDGVPVFRNFDEFVRTDMKYDSNTSKYYWRIPSVEFSRGEEMQTVNYSSSSSKLALAQMYDQMAGIAIQSMKDNVEIDYDRNGMINNLKVFKAKENIRTKAATKKTLEKEKAKAIKEGDTATANNLQEELNKL